MVLNQLVEVRGLMVQVPHKTVPQVLEDLVVVELDGKQLMVL
jgi:hypothetical protein